MTQTKWERQAPDIWVKQNDLAPSATSTLKDGNEVVVDLTGASVKFMMWAPGDASVKVNAAATITSPTTGEVSYAWAAGDTDTIGPYIAEWQVTFSGGLVETFPNGGWLKVVVSDDVAT